MYRRGRKAVSFLLAMLFLLAAVPITSAADTHPVIAMTEIPVFGKTSDICGLVFRKDGAAFNPKDYRISVFVEIPENNIIWVKPYAENGDYHSYFTLNSDGSFVYPYAAGNAIIIHVMLIPGSYIPREFADTKAVAYDYVKITRTSGGSITVSPKREAPLNTDTVPGMPSGVELSENRLAMNIGFYTDGGSPDKGDKVSIQEMRNQLGAIAPFADTVRFYGAAGELTKAYKLAYDMGFRIVGSAWLSKDASANQKELDALIEQCNAGYVTMAVVGSEVLLRGDMSVDALISAIEYVRKNIPQIIPVTTADSIDAFMNYPNLRAACDVYFVNSYPYWNATDISSAADGFIESMNALRTRYPNKELICSETGWPTEGGNEGKAAAGTSEAKVYFEAVRNWSVSERIQIFYFEAADEKWKSAAEGGVGGHWGFLTNTFRLKPAYADTAYFNSLTTDLSNFKRVQTYRSGMFRDVAPASWYAENVKSVYEYGMMIGKSENSFDPTGSITLAEAVTLACRLHKTYYDIKLSERTGKYWYTGYVNYAIACGIISDGEYSDYTKPASRAEVAKILCAALPGDALTTVNSISENAIPTVPMSASYASAVYKLYRAGILNGSDALGSFMPERSITRAEVAAMLTRIADPALRLTFELG